MAHYSTRTAAQEVGTEPWTAAAHAVDDYAWDVQGFLHIPAARADESASILRRIFGAGTETREVRQPPEHGDTAAGDGGLHIYMMNFAFKLMNCVLKMLNFAFKLIYCI